MPTVELDIPPKSLYVGVARLAVSILARSWGIEEERVEDLKIAVSEACANAVLSNERAESPEPVSIAVTVSDDRLEVQVGDRGPTYDPAESESEAWSRLGMSLALMASLVDDSTIGPRPDGGMRCTLVLRRP